jgi:hypothetical protein
MARWGGRWSSGQPRRLRPGELCESAYRSELGRGCALTVCGRHSLEWTGLGRGHGCGEDFLLMGKYCILNTFAVLTLHRDCWEASRSASGSAFAVESNLPELENYRYGGCQLDGIEARPCGWL